MGLKLLGGLIVGAGAFLLFLAFRFWLARDAICEYDTGCVPTSMLVGIAAPGAALVVLGLVLRRR